MARPKLTVPSYRLWEDARGVYHVTWTDVRTGKTAKRSTGERDEAKALARMPDIVREIENPPAPSNYTIGEMLNAYVEARTQSACSRSFVYTIRPLQTYFGSWKPEQLRSDKVWADYRKWRTGQDVSNAATIYAKHRTKRKVSDSTAVRELNQMRGAISWARRNDYKGLQAVEIHLPDSGGKARHRFLTRPEVEKLIASCIEPHTRLFVLLSLATGARMTAVLGIKWSDVTFPGMLPGQGPAFTHASFVDPLAMARGDKLQLTDIISIDMGRGRHNKKRGTGVISPTNWRLWGELNKAWLRSHGFVNVFTQDNAWERRKLSDMFPEAAQPVPSEHVVNYRGRKLGKVDLTDAFRRAGITGATQHTLRHTSISWLVQAGQSYESIGKLVGVSPKIIETNYGHLSPKHLAVVGDVLSV